MVFSSTNSQLVAVDPKKCLFSLLRSLVTSSFFFSFLFSTFFPFQYYLHGHAFQCTIIITMNSNYLAWFGFVFTNHRFILLEWYRSCRFAFDFILFFSWLDSNFLFFSNLWKKEERERREEEKIFFLGVYLNLHVLTVSQWCAFLYENFL